jgi:putative membrane protein
MLLFIKSFIVGIGKIMPGVSGALLAINFNIYERILDALTDFLSDWKNNLKTIVIFFGGVLLSIVLCSNILLYFLNNFKFVTMLFFIGLILGGTYNFGKKINYNLKNIIIILFVLFMFLFLTFSVSNHTAYIKNDNNIVFFIGGYTDIFASILPGISGSSLLMIMGIYNDVLRIIANVFDINYVISNFKIYFSYGLGMIVSFIINIYLINYLLKKHRNIMYLIILGLAIASIVTLMVMTIHIKFNIFGIVFFFLGIFISYILDK